MPQHPTMVTIIFTLLAILSSSASAFLAPTTTTTTSCAHKAVVTNALPHNSYVRRSTIAPFTPLTASSSSSNQQDIEMETQTESTTDNDDSAAAEKNSQASVPCPDCDLCDGSGRILGGIGTVLEWWPIKAYRPCPNFVERGGKYVRSGQGLDEIAFGRIQNE
eukprot:CCRYP_004241-RB/>CCRYP_004241-RB protein AED:0.11 eAED:0.11 QI:159/1/1/1/1/1/3/366/162